MAESAILGAHGVPQPAPVDLAARHRSPRTGSTPCFGGARRDEDKARAKERILSFRDEFGQWDPRNQRPELWHLYNGRVRAGRARAGLPDLRLDRARRVALHRALSSSSCRRSTSPTSARSWRATACVLTANARGRQPAADEQAVGATVRYRTVGDVSCTGAVASIAATSAEVIVEIVAEPHHRARGHPSRRSLLRDGDGGSQARGLLLMTRWELAAAAALHHDRLGRRRQEHADRPPAATTPRPCSTIRSTRSPRRRSGVGRRDSISPLVTDGLRAEREQGITIDVAHRYFATPRRGRSSSPTTPATPSTRATW